MLGRRRAGQILAVVAVLVGNIALIVQDIQPFTVGAAAYVLFDLLPVLALAAFHRDAAPVRWRPWLIALPVGAVLEGGVLLVIIRSDPQAYPMLDWPGLCCLTLVAAAGLHLVARRPDGPSWSLALALLAAAVLGFRTLTLVGYSAAPPDLQVNLLALGLVEAGAVLAVGVPLAIRARQALRRLAPTA